jgi:hypothetical protein
MAKTIITNSAAKVLKKLFICGEIGLFGRLAPGLVVGRNL